MRAFFYRNLLLLLLAGVFVFVGISYVVMTGSHAAETARQEQEIADLDARMQSALSTEKAEQQAVVDASLGTNAQRIAADTVLIQEFIRMVSTWETGDEYTTARDSVIRRYKLDEGSQFLTDYFQGPVFNTDSSGEKFYVIDAEGLNSHLSSVDVKVLGVAGTEYRYMVMAEISSSSNDGKASASRVSVINLTLDGEGVMTDLSGYASGSKPLTSK